MHCYIAAVCIASRPTLQGNREAVAPVVVQLLKEASDACPPGAPAQLAAAPGAALVQGVPPAVLRKEAAYQAVATGAYELHDYVDFTGEQDWFGLSMGGGGCKAGVHVTGAVRYACCLKSPCSSCSGQAQNPNPAPTASPHRLPARQPAG